jgi:hypothetical protein
LPRLLHQRLIAPASPADATMRELASAQRERNALLGVIAALLVALIVVVVLRPM